MLSSRKNLVLTLNQKNIQDFLDCPRKFQLLSLDNLCWPAALSDNLMKIERSTFLGNQFHMICYQYFSGISPDQIGDSIVDPDLKIMWENFLPFGSKFLDHSVYPEQLITSSLLNFRLVAKFDLVVKVSSDKYIILDWKTGANKPSREILNNRVQSYLYPYIFHQSGADLIGEISIKPDQIEMHYFYPSSTEPHEIFPYSSQAHDEVSSRLEGILSKLTNIFQATDEFPLTDDRSQCLYCVFRSLCDRGVAPGSIENYLPFEHENLSNEIFDIGQISEIEF